MNETEPSLDNHEKRIFKLEQSNEDIQKNIKELKDSVMVNQVQSPYCQSTLRVFAIPILILAKFEGEAYQIRYKFTTRVEDMVA